MFSLEIDRIIQNALNEDIGYGDITTESCLPEDVCVRGVFLAKEEGVICGLQILERVFSLIDANIRVSFRIPEGRKVSKGDIIADIEGPARSVLTGERTALNLLQRMSGIATRTSQAVAAVSGTKARITDTRKTTPGLRILEKIRRSGRRRCKPSHRPFRRRIDKGQPYCRRRRNQAGRPTPCGASPRIR